MKSSHPDGDLLAGYVDRDVSPAALAEIEAHLRDCAACRAEVVELQQIRDLDLDGRLVLPDDVAAAATPSPALQQYLVALRGDSPAGASDAAPSPGSRLGVLGGLAGGLAGAIATGLGALAPGHHGELVFAADGSEDEPAPTDADSGGVRIAATEPSLSAEATHVPHAAITVANPVIGTPHADAVEFPGAQHYADTCAIRCQEFIIRQYTGEHLPERFYVEEAKAHGWYDHGTSMMHVGNLLEAHDIPVHRYVNANVYNLTSELSQGHKVIIGVDSGDLWSSNWIWRELRHLFGFGAADHAVVVTGLDTRDPQHVIVSDPGSGEAAARYPLDHFVSAWRGSHFFMVATQEPPPAHLDLPEMRHFDYTLGHTPNVGSLSYDDFERMATDYHAHADDPAWTHHAEDELASRIAGPHDALHANVHAPGGPGETGGPGHDAHHADDPHAAHDPAHLFAPTHDHGLGRHGVTGTHGIDDAGGRHDGPGHDDHREPGDPGTHGDANHGDDLPTGHDHE